MRLTAHLCMKVRFIYLFDLPAGDVLQTNQYEKQRMKVASPNSNRTLAGTGNRQHSNTGRSNTHLTR